jgi:hypothetical protein
MTVTWPFSQYLFEQLSFCRSEKTHDIHHISMG